MVVIVRVAPEVRAEAVRLFLESAYSIVKATVSDEAMRIVLCASLEVSDRAEAIFTEAQRAAPQMAIFLSAFDSMERVEITDTAIVTVKFRIDISALNNPGPFSLQRLFPETTAKILQQPVVNANGKPVLDASGKRWSRS
ncbi:MAG: hypothetical protein M2R45_00223 [Verrucomicrobia subdivision 3 bacterium]|nr:hypothetical protein [Limisphaerales bacterium]MCS1412319.1 hypothetical protein [Limisphaerales bacterium]